MTSRPFNVLYAFVLTETFAAYILIRGILYPFIVSGLSTAQAIVGGVLQALIAAGMTYFGLRFYRGRFGSRLPMILITLCALWVTASTLVMNVSAYGLNIGQSITIAGVIGAAAAFIFVLMPSSRRYIEAVTEASGEERRSTAADAAKSLERKTLDGSLDPYRHLLHSCYSLRCRGQSQGNLRRAHGSAIHHHKTAGWLLTLRESIQW